MKVNKEVIEAPSFVADQTTGTQEHSLDLEFGVPSHQTQGEKPNLNVANPETSYPQKQKTHLHLLTQNLIP